MRRFQSVLILSWTLAATVTAAAAPPPRLVLYHLDGKGPAAETLIPVLTAQLEDADMEIETVAVELTTLPPDDAAWFDLARNTAADARTIGAVAYVCTNDTCALTVIQLRSRAVFSIDFSVPEAEDARRFTLAATLRELLLGPLLGETRRLAAEAAAPSSPEKSPSVLLRSPFEEGRKERETVAKRPLFLELAYQGDYPHPTGLPIHGVCAGINYEPAAMFGVALHLGWLGMGSRDYDGSSISMHRMDTTVTARLIFPLGPAKISIGAVGRVDWVFLNVDNPPMFADTHDRYAEIHVGGITNWHLPLPYGLQLLIGAGLTASVLSQEVQISGGSGVQETAMPASTLRMIWTAGVAFSPFGALSGQ